MTRRLAVLDIDGTVADVQHRLPLLNSDSPTRWADFFDAAADDPLLPDGAALARQLANEHEIVWLTGRPERLRGVTESWLDRHGLPSGRLAMQEADDKRPARLVKLERIRQLAADHEIAVVVDDDPRVVEHLRRAGLPMHQATWLPWQPVLGQNW
ncbi:hypothetical protein N8J89_12760 [Crossiella sp. CA-258035]|uniref:phosphatase domain-containing protein n=1 Tax=Crossiella sp. CA-258035 TaxID=2981138 RepID=UPI0024BC838A|nr:hypothetical protein [Crossiella sp. CA-258035]WHT21891.1 hypothetical protein N8J89_12760 [Crossiella sp. CA-258035]